MEGLIQTLEYMYICPFVGDISENINSIEFTYEDITELRMNVYWSILMGIS